MDHFTRVGAVTLRTARTALWWFAVFPVSSFERAPTLALVYMLRQVGQTLFYGLAAVWFFVGAVTSSRALLLGGVISLSLSFAAALAYQNLKACYLALMSGRLENAMRRAAAAGPEGEGDTLDASLPGSSLVPASEAVPQLNERLSQEPALDWSSPAAIMFVKMVNPVYAPNERKFVAEFRVGSVRPLGQNIQLRSYWIELRLNSQAVATFDFKGSDSYLSSGETLLSRVLFSVKDTDGPTESSPPGFDDMTATQVANGQQWNVRASARVICMLAVPGIPLEVKLDYHTDEQMCAVRLLGLSKRETDGALGRI